MNLGARSASISALRGISDLVYDVRGGTFVKAALLSIGSPAWTNDVQCSWVAQRLRTPVKIVPWPLKVEQQDKLRCALTSPAKRISDFDGVYHSEVNTNCSLLKPMAKNGASTYVPPPHISYNRSLWFLSVREWQPILPLVISLK